MRQQGFRNGCSGHRESWFDVIYCGCRTIDNREKHYHHHCRRHHHHHQKELQQLQQQQYEHGKASRERAGDGRGGCIGSCRRETKVTLALSVINRTPGRRTSVGATTAAAAERETNPSCAAGVHPMMLVTSVPAIHQ